MNVDAVFDAFGKFSELVHLRDALDKKNGQVRAVTTYRCGNCDHWMKTTCVPEKQHGQFKSCESVACGAFTLSPGSKRLMDQFNAEATEIRTKLNALGK